MNEMYPSIKGNAIPNNNQLIIYYLPVRYLLRIQQYHVNNTYNNTNTKQAKNVCKSNKKSKLYLLRNTTAVEKIIKSSLKYAKTD